MKRILAVVLFCFMALGVFALPISASPVNAGVTVKMSTTEPVLDGVVSEGEYGEKIHTVDYSSDEFIAEFDTDKDIRADFYMTWKEDSLYMAWVVFAEKHTPIDASIDYNRDGKADAEIGGTDLAYMYLGSCVQFMLCTGAPDIHQKKYQTNTWSGNYLEAGLVYLNDGKSQKFMWSVPQSAVDFTAQTFDFCGSRDEENKTTTYETRIPLAALGMQNIGAGTRLGLIYAVGDQENFETAPNMCEWQNGILNGKNMDAGAVITLSDATTDGLIVGAPVQNPDYNITVSAPASYMPGDTLQVKMTLNDIQTAGGYPYIKLSLYYDKDKVEPVVKNDGDVNEAMSSFLEKAPNKNSWEGICRLDENDARYDISFMNPSFNGAAVDHGDLVISVPFNVKSGATGKIIFQVPHKSTLCVDTNLKKHYSNAGMAAVEPAVEDEDLTLKPGSRLTIESDNGRRYLKGMRDETTVNEIKAEFSGSVTILDRDGNPLSGSDYVGTGCTVTAGTNTVTVFLLGDANGDGVVDSLDYLIAKRIIIGTAAYDDLTVKAVCVTGGDTPDSLDYLRIKKYCISTYDLYGEGVA